MSRVFITAALALGTIAGSLLAGGDPPQTPTYTTAQAARGSETYTKTCFVCHGANLDDGQFASPLKGPAFRQKRGGQGLDALFTIMTTQMPPDNPGGLGAATYADVLAFILSKNNVAPSPDRELPADVDALKGMLTPQDTRLSLANLEAAGDYACLRWTVASAASGKRSTNRAPRPGPSL